MVLILVLVLNFVTVTPAAAEDGYDLWLRYRPIGEPDLLEAYRGQIRGLHFPGDSPTLDAARRELEQGLTGLLDCPLPEMGASAGGVLLVGTPASNPAIEGLALEKALEPLGREGFLIRTVSIDGNPAAVIAANDDIGVLYGTFRFLQLIQMHRPMSAVDLAETPKLRYRVLNHWDYLNGVVSRGYAGRSLWKWDELPEEVSPRYTDYARACASVGINASILNGVNSGAEMLRESYLRKTAAIAGAFRPYGVRVGICARFDAPIEVGNLDTADPRDARVQQWWQDKADEIYELIPDFAGFLVKADSEGAPGPHDYGVTHADGANVMADALAPHGGIVMWRAFGVFDSNVKGYPGDAATGLGLAARPTDLFTRIDGDFHDNVFVQAKLGPRDFQPREAPHPLLGGMEETPVMMEVQITQEYYGHSIHLVYVPPQWKEVLEFDTHARGEGSTVARVLEGTVFGNADMTGMAGVANAGDVRNWTGHLFGQANWYAFGKLAWDPDLSCAQIAEEWIRLTFSSDPEVLSTIKAMMLGSREAAVEYMTPLGLFQLNDNRTTEKQRSHYAPAPERRTGQHNADESGIGGSWITEGVLDQYHPGVRRVLADRDTCPEKYLLFFHHVSWDRMLSTGRTVWEELCHRYVRGVEYVKKMRRQWQSLKSVIDEERWKHVDRKLEVQIIDAETWRNECLIYFSALSGRPVPPEILAVSLSDENDS
jgi:alpha-glucuronidase